MLIDNKWFGMNEVDYITQPGSCDWAKIVAQDKAGKQLRIDLREDDIVRLKQVFAACPDRMKEKT